ncbi:MAG: cation diffusion facilitator family transporter [Candidatus Diapherotrites archaeon]|nr:cation diffusion facilitator family transporter [Candidatus Diapherotrites archaeon]
MNKLERTAILSTLANIFLSIIKLVAGLLFSSIALIADAMHSFTDIIGSLAVFFGIKFSTIKSKRFPYGLYKLENLISLFVSLLIFYAAFEIASDALVSLHAAKQIISIWPSLVAFFSFIFVFVLAKYKEKIGKAENSPSMLAEAKHSLGDAASSLAVVAGVTLSFLGMPYFDPIVGFAVALLVFKSGAEILLDSVKVLLDASLDYATMRRIEKLASKQKNVRVKEIIARNSGRFVFVELKLETNLKDLKAVSRLQKECEEKIKKEIPRIDRITIEIEYKKKPVLCYAVPLESNSLKSRIAQEFGLAKYFGLFKVDIKKRKLIEYSIIENPNWNAKHRRGILAAELLAEHNVDVLLNKGALHKGGAYYALQDSFIEIKKTKAKSFEELLKKYGGAGK